VLLFLPFHLHVLCAGPGQVLAHQRVHARGHAGAVAAWGQGPPWAKQAAAAASTARTGRKFAWLCISGWLVLLGIEGPGW
jgi:hypothetical protein